VPAGRVFVDGKGVGEVGDVVLRDRRHLSEDGLVLAVLAIGQQSGDIVAGPDLVSRGVVDVRSGVTRTFALSEAAAAFETATRREGMKVVIRPADNVKRDT